MLTTAPGEVSPLMRTCRVRVRQGGGLPSFINNEVGNFAGGEGAEPSATTVCSPASSETLPPAPRTNNRPCSDANVGGTTPRLSAKNRPALLSASALLPCT